MYASVLKFNPNHDKLGRFSSRGASQAGEVFASSHMGTNMSVGAAKLALQSRDYARFKFISQKIDRGLGLLGGVNSAIGAWKDGAEHSTMTSYHSASMASLKVAAAMRGLLGNQKGVIPFQYDPKGPSRIHEFTVGESDAAQLNKDLVEAGLEFHTLVPNKTGGHKVVIFDEKGSLEHDQTVNVVASKLGATTAATFHGRGELLGSWTSRSKGKVEYMKVINQWLAQNPGNKAIWKDIKQAWASGVVKSQETTLWAI